MSKNQVTTVVQNTMPAFLQGMQSSRGAENVTTDDLIIPRLEIVQSLSPCRKKSDPSYVDGAEEGMLYNNVTRELYGPEVMLMPVFYKKEWLIWKDRLKGGGFRGAFPSELEAAQFRATLDNPDDYDIQDTAQQFCLLVKADGTAEEIVVSMAKTKLKASRKWNSLIRLAGGDSFSRVYRLSGVNVQNANGDEYYTIDVANAGFPTEELYRRAEALYDAVSAGKAKVSEAVDGVAGDEADY